MDKKLEKALDFANYRQSLAIKRKTIKEKADAKLTYGINGGLFKVDRALITFVQMLIDQDRKTNIPLIDSNDNPVMIEDVESFRDDILDRYFAVTLEYHDKIKELNKARSVEKLLDL